jgi:SAM-dependent methyltransferase
MKRATNPIASLPLLGKILAGVLAWEGAWWARRRLKRGAVYNDALRQSIATGKPLIVVGAPDAGVTSGYGCGHLTVDLIPRSSCPRFLRADISRPLPFPDDSCVVFVSCVLEYVERFREAYDEIRRIAGPNLYIIRVEPWTLAAYVYPGAQRTLPASLPGVR